MSYFLLILGFVLLIKGADIFVDGASALASKIGIPKVIVGLTIVSIGTSAPELAVSLVSSIKGNNDMALGNVLGSNIFNDLMVLGVSTIILYIYIDKKKVKADFIVNVFVTLLLFILAFDSIFLNKTNNISRIDGIILVVLCIIYIIFLVLKAKKQNVSTEKDTNIKIGVKIVLIILGIAGIVAGGQLVVNSATKIALNLGMSEKLVGLTIVAIGTSLPELVTSAMAAYKGENEIALGNVIGSNIFNIILILGLSSIISPINVQNDLIIDFIFLIFITLLIYVISFWGKSKEKNITRFEGIIFVILYVVYMVYIIIRN